ncbi:hypothetical protein ACOSQ2_025728 [Xanthoceras sorbifolium]
MSPCCVDPDLLRLLQGQNHRMCPITYSNLERAYEGLLGCINKTGFCLTKQSVSHLKSLKIGNQRSLLQFRKSVSASVINLAI